MIYGFARNSGLTDDEAQEAVQETLIGVAKHIPTFRYDPAIGSFKSWLLNMTRWRIVAQFRKRQQAPEHLAPVANSTTRTDPVDRLPDPNGKDWIEVWEREWERNVLEAALSRVKKRLNPQQYRVFDFYVNKEWPPEKVADRFGISADQVYQIKHRVTAAIREEVRRLQKDMN